MLLLVDFVFELAQLPLVSALFLLLKFCEILCQSVSELAFFLIEFPFQFLSGLGDLQVELLVYLSLLFIKLVEFRCFSFQLLLLLTAVVCQLLLDSLGFSLFGLLLQFFKLFLDGAFFGSQFELVVLAVLFAFLVSSLLNHLNFCLFLSL